MTKLPHIDRLLTETRRYSLHALWADRVLWLVATRAVLPLDRRWV